MTSELKPCPFCGGENITINHYNCVYYVMCESCECRGDFYDTADEAIVAWNQRYEQTCEGCSRYRDDDYCWSCSKNFPNMYKPKVVE